MSTIKLSGLFLVLFMSFASAANAQLWDMREKSLGAALAYEGKTSNDTEFGGTKLSIDGRYFLGGQTGEVSGKRKCCALPSRPEYF